MGHYEAIPVAATTTEPFDMATGRRHEVGALHPAGKEGDLPRSPVYLAPPLRSRGGACSNGLVWQFS
jgi:hypothetical protein